LFKVINVNGRAMLVKVDPLVKFIEEGLRHEKMETRQSA